MPFDGRQTSMKDDLRWKTTFDGRRPSMEPYWGKKYHPLLCLFLRLVALFFYHYHNPPWNNWYVTLNQSTCIFKKNYYTAFDKFSWLNNSPDHDKSYQVVLESLVLYFTKVVNDFYFKWFCKWKIWGKTYTVATIIKK